MAKKIKLFFDDQPTKNNNQYRGVGYYSKELLKGLKKSSLVTLVKNPDQADLIHQPYFAPFTHQKLKNIKKTIITVHDLVPLELPRLFPQGLKAKLTWLHNKQMLKMSAHIITDSVASKNSIHRFTGVSLSKITSIPLASRPSLKSTSGLSGKDYALYVGDVNPNKNLPQIIKACLKTNTPLVVVGKSAVKIVNNPNHAELKDLVFLQDQVKLNPNKIKLLGFVSDSKLSKLYGEALVCLQPSLAEGFGLPVLEALKLGCPVITSDRSSLPEVAGNFAIYVNPTHLGEIIKAIEKIKSLSSVKREALVSGGKNHANKFTWEKTISKTLSIYASIK